MPIKITPPDLKTYNMVISEYDAEILQYQRQIAEKDTIIDNMKQERNSLYSKIELTNVVRGKNETRTTSV